MHEALIKVQEDHDRPAISENSEKMSLLMLAESSMAHAMLIFLMADLRNLSATGRIRTRFEYLRIPSDMCPRRCARDFTGNTEPTPIKGITAAHIMAVLLLEFTKAADEAKLEQEATRRKSESMLLGDDDEEDGIFGLADLQTATGLPALLKGYHNMLTDDIVEDTPLISKSEWPLKPRDDILLKSHNRFQSGFDCDVIDEEEEDFFGTGFFKQSALAQNLGQRFGQSILGQSLGQSILSRRREYSFVKSFQDLVDVHDHLFTNDPTEPSSSGETEYHNKDGVLSLLEHAVEQRDYSSLGFMRKFFKEGSISHLLLESKSEVVWLSDWHLKHECTYAISIDREKKKVFLALRGSKSKWDTLQVKDVSFTATSNPIQEQYPGRSRNIRMRGNYHKYLFRVRKDTRTTKYDEIVTRLARYCDEIGTGVTITMSGHSIGAALATIVALYLSTDPQFTQFGAIEVVTFGCPYIGGFKFADAVMHQEAKGLLRIARFHNSRDGAAHLPPTLFSMSKRGAIYFNNGIDVELPLIRTGIFKVFGQAQPIVRYNGRKSFLRSWMKQIKDCYFFNLPVRFWLRSKMHPLVEHQKRLHLINLLQDPESSPLTRFSLEDLYKIRDEL